MCGYGSISLILDYNVETHTLFICYNNVEKHRLSMLPRGTNMSLLQRGSSQTILCVQIIE